MILNSSKQVANLQSGIVVHVPDRRRWMGPEVVLVGRWVIWVLGIWRGRVGRRGGQGRSVYKQPETEVDGSCHS